MVDTTIEQLKEQIKELRQYLPEKTKEELSQILVFGEKMKAEGEKQGEEFWRKYHSEYFKNLLVQYEESKEKFIESLAPGEKKMLNNLNWLSKEKFCNEYLYKRIIYSGDINRKYDGSGSIKYKNENKKFDLKRFNDWVNDHKDKLKSGMKIDLEGNYLGEKGIKILAETWKDKLQPLMEFSLGRNNLGEEGIKILAEIWRNSLQPGIGFNLYSNNLGYEGIKILAETWKDSLKPGMRINLYDNNIGEEGVKILAETWKDSLKPGMRIGLHGNNLGDKGVKILAEVWKDKLQPGMGISLGSNNVGYEGAKILAETWKDSLKPGMQIDLDNNDLGNEGMEVIMQNWKLKERMNLVLQNNNTSSWMRRKLFDWGQGYKKQGIDMYIDC